ncbi:MAG TPA: hypothetical protein VGL38_14490 [bacterium]|jgi:hypothetical protein
MDSATRTAILEKERALFRVTETLLVMLFVLTALFAVNLRVAADFMALWPLRAASDGFHRAVAEWTAQNAPKDSLAANTDRLSAFAHQALNWKPTPATDYLRTVVAVDNPNYPGLRVYLKDSLLGTTPGLDTTRIHYVVASGPLREEYYLPYAQQAVADRLRKAWFPWLFAVAEVILMAVVYAFHRWLRRLASED